MLTGLPLRRAILETLKAHKKDTPEASLVKQDELAKILQVDLQRLDAHFVFLERSGYISFLAMNDPHGNRQRFVSITDEGEAYLKTERPAVHAKGLESPFKVVEKTDEKTITDFKQLREYVASTEWVLDEEKPEIMNKLHELEKTVASDKLDPAKLSLLKIYFERHKWLAPHVTAIIKKTMGF